MTMRSAATTSSSSTLSTRRYAACIGLAGALACTPKTDRAQASPPASAATPSAAADPAAADDATDEAVVAAPRGRTPLVGAAERFAAAGVDGAFILRRGDGDDQVYGGELVDARRVPCSTFKIANALIAVDEGVVDGPDFTLEWDGVKRWSDAWNRDHDLRSAMEVSAVWYFQELARRIGAAAMASRLAALDYGNAEIGEVVDMFWLVGPLEISAAEELEFVDRLVRGDLPVSERAAAIVRDVMPTREFGAARVRAKTGTCVFDDEGDDRPPHAWLVGWVERGDVVDATFALMVTGPAQFEPLTRVRWPLVAGLLEDAGVLGEGAGG